MVSVLGPKAKNCLQASGQQKPRNANKRKRVKGLLPPKQSVDRIWRHQTGPSPQNGASFVGFIDGNARRCQPRSQSKLEKVSDQLRRNMPSKQSVDGSNPSGGFSSHSNGSQRFAGSRFSLKINVCAQNCAQI